jgi:hypothetical protein
LRSRRLGSCIIKHGIISFIAAVVAWTCVNQFLDSAPLMLNSDTFNIFIFLCGFVVGFFLEVFLRFVVFGFHPTPG